MTPCAHPGCPTPTNTGRCPKHQRTPNLARNHLPALIRRDHNICHHCGQPCGPRTNPPNPNSPTIDHLNHNTADNTPTNLALAHNKCNAQREH